MSGNLDRPIRRVLTVGPPFDTLRVDMAKPKAALREYRERHSLTCEEAGRKVGIAESTWRSYENGNREVDGDMAVKIEAGLGVPREVIRPDLFKREAA